MPPSPLLYRTPVNSIREAILLKHVHYSLRNLTIICQQLTIQYKQLNNTVLCIKRSLTQGLNLCFLGGLSMAASHTRSSILGIRTQRIPNFIPRCEQNRKLTSLSRRVPWFSNQYIIMRCTPPPSRSLAVLCYLSMTVPVRAVYT